MKSKTKPFYVVEALSDGETPMIISRESFTTLAKAHEHVTRLCFIYRDHKDVRLNLLKCVKLELE